MKQSNAKYKAATDKHKRRKCSLKEIWLWCFCAREDIPLGLNLRQFLYSNFLDDILMPKTFNVVDLFQYNAKHKFREIFQSRSLFQDQLWKIITCSKSNRTYNLPKWKSSRDIWPSVIIVRWSVNFLQNWSFERCFGS